MASKEYVLVSQGIEIYRTKDRDEAYSMMQDSNKEYYEYRQWCADNYERPADNEVFMYEETKDDSGCVIDCIEIK